MAVRIFVSPDGNGFMTDIATWLAEAAREAGRPAEVVSDGSLPDGELIDLVVAPHEFFELTRHPIGNLQRAAAASICVNTEQPGTTWFRFASDACARGLLTLDISTQGQVALSSMGVTTWHLQLGGVPSMEVGAAEDRSIDVLFVGSLDDRRGEALARLAPRLHRRTTELRLFRFDRPATPGTPGLLFGAEKYRLLSSAKLLLNVHRARPPQRSSRQQQTAPYFEWARMVEAMANGCVVLTEPSEGTSPLRPGVHFVEADLDAMADAIDQLLVAQEEREAIAAAARAEIEGPLALRRSLGPILDRIEHEVVPRLRGHVQRSRPTRGVWRLGASQVPPPVRLGPFRPYLQLQRRAKELALAENDTLRALDGAACLLRHGTPQHIEESRTPAYDAVDPEVSVVVTVYNYAEVVVETLDSIAASEDVAYEIVIVEDHATDRSRDVVHRFMTDHPSVPILLVAKDANAGLARARNTGFERARASKVMVMDADNAVYPLCLRRLSDRLAIEPTASAVYAILEDFGSQQHVRSAFPWDVDRLCAANYIDAQAMWRADAWRTLGGYRDDDQHVHGWEDWDLWLRLAGTGGHASLVPQILGRYRVQAGSMIALTNLATDEAIEAMRARHPRLPWPVVPT
ncbi:MAG: glycosyltransferase [Ilumatobacteraceae bacterium]